MCPTHGRTACGILSGVHSLPFSPYGLFLYVNWLTLGHHKRLDLSKFRRPTRVVGMSALGQKRTYAVQNGMSANDPKRTWAGLMINPFQCAGLSRYDAVSEIWGRI